MILLATGVFVQEILLLDDIKLIVTFNFTKK